MFFLWVSAAEHAANLCVNKSQPEQSLRVPKILTLTHNQFVGYKQTHIK